MLSTVADNGPCAEGRSYEHKLGVDLDRVLYRDGLIIILDKPAGLPVHGGPGGGDHLELYLDALRFGLAQPPGLGHRLDRASGCLALGRHRKALRRLGRIFSEGLAEKTYWALLDGVPPAATGCVTAPLHKVSTGAARLAHGGRRRPRQGGDHRLSVAGQ